MGGDVLLRGWEGSRRSGIALAILNGGTYRLKAYERDEHLSALL